MHPQCYNTLAPSAQMLLGHGDQVWYQTLDMDSCLATALHRGMTWEFQGR